MFGMMIIVTPFGEMIDNIKARQVGTGVLEIDHDQLLVFIRWMK